MKKNPFLLLCALLTGSLSGHAQLQLRADNIDEIVAAMTLEEKATLVVGTNHHAAAASADMIGGHTDLVPGAAGATQAIARLGIPPSILTDGPAGVRISPKREGTDNTFYCTGFPVGTALACTWNQELVEEVGRAIGNEVLEYGCDVLLAPGMNIHRNPLCGRNFEYYSEDPVVTGKTAAAYIRGVQSQGVGCSVKHFAGNSQETWRTEVNEVIRQRALREIYLKGFEIAVKEAAPWTVMSSYNRLNGPFTQESKELLTTILRDEWGFDGIVMTDWTGMRNTAAQIQAGNDLMEPGYPAQTEDLIAKVQSGVLDVADLDRCVKRILQYLVKTPHFRRYAFSNRPDLKSHAAITRQSATEGMVLLKNERQTLPLSGQPKVSVFGITSYDFIAGGTGSGDVNKAYTIDLMTGLNEAGLEVNETLAGLYQSYKAYHEKEQQARPHRGWFWGKEKLDEMPLKRSIINRQAEESDLAIVTLGRQAGEGGDRKEADDFLLTETERQLLADVTAAFHIKGKRVVVILNTGGVIETASWSALPDAILCAWQPGQEGGYSVADVLTGKANPSGRLSMTWPVALSDLPSSNDFPNYRRGHRSWGAGEEFKDYTLHNEGIWIGYRHFASSGQPVAYPFGYGLSYTDFDYKKASVKKDKDGFTATITVTNTGKVAGKQVVQLYVAAPKGGLDKPARELKAYAKTRLLQPGESETLRMSVSAYELASYNEASQAWETAAGNYQVQFGVSAEDIRASAGYQQQQAQSWPCHTVLAPDRELKAAFLR